MMLRSILEHVTRPLVFKRRLPVEFGKIPLTVSPSAGLSYLFRPMRSVDPILLNMVDEFVKPGAIVWDVGANLGLFAFSSAQRAGVSGKVLAFEPDLWLVRLLRRTAKIQPPSSAQVTIAPTAIASSVGLRTFCIAARSRATNYLAGYGTSQTGGEAERQTVVAMTLDSLLEENEPPTVLKIDTEGAELEVFRGAKRLFELHRPIVISEVSSDSASAVTEFLSAHGYRLFDANDARGNRLPISLATWNTLAIPDGHPSNI